MNPKYEKPIVRNLGDLLPNAQGDCKAGSTAIIPKTCASGLSPNSNGTDCNPGGTAAGACISTGGHPI